MTMLAPTILAPVLLGVLGVSLALAAWRMLRGPGYADRFVALDMLTAVVVCCAALVALATGRGAFLEVGLGAALINFVSTCAFAAFLERRRAGGPR
jgi:multicomponent Na+:H+ antiporter subunit F